MMELVLFATLIASTQSNFHVHLGDTTTCAAYNGEVKCWGDNNYGQLGVDYNTGDELEPLPDPIDLGTDFFADTVGCGGSHCCAVSTAKELKCWGWCTAVACDYSTFGDAVGNEAGEMAKLEPYSYVPGLVDVVTLWYMTCVLHQGDAGQNEIECIGADINGKGLPVGEVPLDDVDWSPSGVGGGYYTLCAFDSATAGALKCFGAVAVNIDVSTLLIESLQCGRYHCCALTVERSLTCWGDDYNVGQWDTSQIPSDFGAVQDYAMSQHSTCVLSADGNVVCFGEDVAEQLGGGSFVISSEFTHDGVRLAHSAPAEAQYCLYEEASSLLLQCWGYNSHGQLGYGDKSTREMGPDLGFVDLGWIVNPPSGTGCDAASFRAQGCTGGENCYLEDLNRWSGECCTTEFQCLEGEGDCDTDNDCAGALVCGRNNCGDDSPFQDTHDCCTPVAEGPTGCDAKSFDESPGCTEGENCKLENGRWSGSCCTSEFQCLEGEGDCDSDSDCAPGLVCGTNNCGDPFQDTHDCCEESEEVSVSASVAVSAGAAVVAEDGSGADEANPDGNTTVIWMEAVFGAVIAAVLISAAVLLVLFMAKRRGSAGKKAETEICDAVHVPELTPTDCAEMDTVEVVTAKDTGDAEEVPSSELAEAMTTADAGNTESV